MADTTFSVRASEDVQTKFKEFSDASEFKNKGDFLNHLLILYAAQEASQQVPTLESAVKAVNEMADRVSKILVGVSEVIISNQEKIKSDAEARLSKTNNKIILLETEIDKLKMDADVNQSTIEALKTHVTQAEDRMKSLFAIIDDKTALNNTYTSRIEELSIQIREFEDQQHETDKLRIQLQNANQKIIEEQDANQQLKLNSDKALINLEKQLRSEAQEEQARFRQEMEQFWQRLISLHPPS